MPAGIRMQIAILSYCAVWHCEMALWESLGTRLSKEVYIGEMHGSSILIYIP